MPESAITLYNHGSSVPEILLTASIIIFFLAMTAARRNSGCSALLLLALHRKCFNFAVLFCVTFVFPAAMSFQVVPALRRLTSKSLILKSDNHSSDDAPTTQPSCWILQEDEIPQSVFKQDQNINLSNVEWFQTLQQPVLAYHNATDEVVLAYWGKGGTLCELRWHFDGFDWRSLLNQEYDKSAFCCDGNLFKELRRRTEARAKTQELLSSLRRDRKVTATKKSTDDIDDETSQRTLQDLPQIKTFQDYLEEAISTGDDQPDQQRNPQSTWNRRRVIGPAFEHHVSVEEETALVSSYFTMRNALEVASYRWMRKVSNRTKENDNLP